MIRNRLQGWLLTHHASDPITGRYRATRFGVGICAGTYEELVSMIRRRE